MARTSLAFPKDYVLRAAVEISAHPMSTHTMRKARSAFTHMFSALLCPIGHLTVRPMASDHAEEMVVFAVRLPLDASTHFATKGGIWFELNQVQDLFGEVTDEAEMAFAKALGVEIEDVTGDTAVERHGVQGTALLWKVMEMLESAN